jgi:hypothetical protein
VKRVVDCQLRTIPGVFKPRWRSAIYISFFFSNFYLLFLFFCSFVIRGIRAEPLPVTHVNHDGTWNGRQLGSIRGLRIVYTGGVDVDNGGDDVWWIVLPLFPLFPPSLSRIVSGWFCLSVSFYLFPSVILFTCEWRPWATRSCVYKEASTASLKRTSAITSVDSSYTLKFFSLRRYHLPSNHNSDNTPMIGNAIATPAPHHEQQVKPPAS